MNAQEVASASPSATRPDVGGPERDSSRRLRSWAAALAVWSTLYALAHVYWATGGQAGFSLLKPAATELEAWQEINAVASVVLIIPVGIAVGLARGRHQRRVRWTLLAGCLAGASIAVSHGVYGIVYRILNLTGVVSIDGRAFDLSTDAWVVWDFVLFEPWFLIEGILFVGTGRAALLSDLSRRRWVAACVLGATTATAVGLFGLRFG